MKTKTFVDIDPNFTANPVTGDIMTNNDTRAILFAVKNLVLTNFYERLFHSEIGSPVNQLLFDLVDDPQFSIAVILSTQTKQVITILRLALKPLLLILQGKAM